MSEPTQSSALSIRNLSVSYGTKRLMGKTRPAVQDISFDVAHGQTVGLVGESGSGKSTIVKAILGLATASNGEILLNGADITHAAGKARRPIVSQLRAVFQDPFASLSPYQTIGETIVEGLRGQRLDRAAMWDRAGEALESVGLTREDLNRLPHQFSGGQRQRIGIARALASSPQIVLMDEPVSALDLSAQAHVINLLADLRDTQRYAFLFVGHDLSVVRFLCQQVVVLYRGMVMEVGNAELVTTKPRNPYTVALVNAAPIPDPIEQAKRREARITIGTQGKRPVSGSGDGCPFAPRCPNATDLCTKVRPVLRQVDDRQVACHHPV
ncbi:ABC transporter ATP-binding protein [Paraburkholderia guartelaensis]|uniref:ABC transporter ATP-binding protein n=1 Tax=Paraburkholderia guartelaensis TaxID=2546446 RepID=UPI002AB69368|nr:ABC transporter ATP-binding protein [Paraburkholderia guartelaensis]